MSLHHSKRIAILHWFNSFSSYDLSKITDLADGKHFCDIISSVFNRISHFPSNLHSTVVDSTSTTEPVVTDFNVQIKPEQCIESIQEIETEPIDIDVKNEITLGANDIKTEFTDVDIKFKTAPTIEFDTNSETEIYPFDVDTTDDSEAAKIEKEVKYIQGELSKSLGNKLDTSDVEDNKENKSGDNGEDIFGDKTPLSAKKKPRSKNICKTELVSKNNEKNSFELEVIEQRFHFIKQFIDEMYLTESEFLVDYTLCMKSNELELAKVGILILSLVVRQCLKNASKDQLNTLTLLDIKVQEDIQECLSVLLQEEQISKKEIHKILTNPGKYKSSPRKSPRFSTPGRDSRRKNSSVLTMTLSHEDVFTNSPLKSFLESPQLKKVLVAKDAELVKARKILHAEELRSEELQIEVNHMKKKLKDKDEEIQKLKCQIKQLKPIEDVQECETCFILQNDLKSAKSAMKSLEEDILFKDKLYEEEVCKLTHELTMLQGKVKYLVQKQSESSTTMPDDMLEAVKSKNDEINSLKDLNNKLKAQLEELLRSYSFAVTSHQVTEEKDESVLYPVPPGECVGSIIEEENKKLHQALLQVKKTLEKLFRKWDIKEKIVNDFKNNLNFSIRNDSTILDSSSQSENDRTSNEPDANNLSQSIDSNSPVSSTQTKLQKLSPMKKRKYSGSLWPDDETFSDSDNKCEISYISLPPHGSLLADVPFSDSNDRCEISQSHFTDGTKVDLFKQLGFNEANYSVKIEIVKKFLNSLKELFYSNGCNGLNNCTLGDLEEKLKSEEDCLKCLLCVRETLLKFQADTSVSLTKCGTDVSEASKKPLSCCDIKLETIDHLQKENEELKVNLSKTKSMCSAELEEKLSEIRELSSQLSAAEHHNQELLKVKQQFAFQNKELIKKLEGLNSQVSNMSYKVAENEHIKKQYAALFNVKNETDQKYQKQMKLFREKILSYEIQKRELQTTIEKEKGKIKEMVPQIEVYKNEIATLKIQRKHLDKFIKDLKAANEQLMSYNELCKEKILQQKRSYEKIISIYKSKSAQSIPQGGKDNVQNMCNKNVEGNVQNGNDPNAAGPSNHVSISEAAPESCHESSMSNSVFNKSVHHGNLMLFTDDEEGFLNYSSISEVKKEHETPDKHKRLLELNRRNTLYLPHMRSSYPIELQNMSPFNSSLYEHIKKTPLGKPGDKCSADKHSIKKRKMSELQQPSVSASRATVAPSTPKMRRTFKTPASLKKLIHYRKKL